MNRKFKKSSNQRCTNSRNAIESDFSDSALNGNETFQKFRQQRIGNIRMNGSSDVAIGNEVRVAKRSQCPSTLNKVNDNTVCDQNTGITHQSSAHNNTASFCDLSNLVAQPIVQIVNMITVLVIVCLVKHLFATFFDN